MCSSCFLFFYAQVVLIPHMHAPLNEWSFISASENALLSPLKFVPACVSASAKVWECKGPLRCPLGSCDCTEAEHCVQQAAALRKSLLLLLQTGNCLPESVPVLSREEERESRGDWCRGRESETEVQGEKQHVIPAREHGEDFYLFVEAFFQLAIFELSWPIHARQANVVS